MPGPEQVPRSSLTDRLLGYEDRFARLKLDGQAQITTPQWAGWLDSKNSVLPTPFSGSEPEKYRTLSYEEIARKGKGWKLHLNFDAEDEAKTSSVVDLLTAMEELDMVSAYKIGRGGGKKAGAPGKEATVYVGHRDKTMLVAGVIEDMLGSALDLPEGDTLVDDTEFTPKVMGRFELTRLDPDFMQYGFQGTPYLLRDYDRYAAVKIPSAEKVHHATDLLTQRYGEFYIGTPQVLPA